jgi:hypothetical protein
MISTLVILVIHFVKEVNKYIGTVYSYNEEGEKMTNEFELYFYFDGDHESEDEDAAIVPLCCECHDRELGYLGFYYKGPLTQWKYNCKKCDTTIKDGLALDQPANSLA